MASQIHLKRPLDIKERVMALQDSRFKKKLKPSHSIDGLWEAPINIKTNRFTYEIADAVDKWPKLNLNRRSTLLSIFEAMYSQKLIKEVLLRRDTEYPQAFQYSHNGKMVVSLLKMYQFLAIEVRMQALQNPPAPNGRKQHSQDVAFQNSINYFVDKYKNIPPLIGRSFVRKMHTEFFISTKEMSIFNDLMEDFIIQLGECAAGDEKLVKWTGDSPFIRVCPSKPAGIGHWHYELCVRLKSGRPILIQTSLHDSSKAYGETVPTSLIVKGWSDLIQSRGCNATILVFDSYYLDNGGRTYLNTSRIKYIASIQKSRFEEVISNLDTSSVTKPGQFTVGWNNKTHEIAVFHWYKQKELGKKYVLSNSFSRLEQRTPPQEIPVSDVYSVTFNICDQFNQQLHGRTWPYRCGSGTNSGTNRRIHDFIFSSILLNLYHIWADFKNLDTEDPRFSYQNIMLELSHQIYVKSGELSSDGIIP